MLWFTDVYGPYQCVIQGGIIAMSSHETQLQVGDASVIIMSDDESNASNLSEDLFVNNEDSCDVAEMEQGGTNVVTFTDMQCPNDENDASVEKKCIASHNAAAPEHSTTIGVKALDEEPRKSPRDMKSSASTDLDLRDKMEESMSRLGKDADATSNFGYYMQLKKDKLRYQVNVLDRPAQRSSEIFKGISIFVNGHTEPTALELRQLIQLHGGEYHCYYEYGVTSYVIATSLASAKVSKTRQNEKFVRPEWIVDSIANGKLMDVENYILLPTQRKETTLTNLQRKPPQQNEDKILDARDPNFLEEFYARSRLHLISTLAQELKDYVCSLRASEQQSFPGRESLKYLRNDSFKPFARTIFHVDLDCFFVSVALRDRPDLKDKPIAITHSKGVGGGFSELASVSYPARSCGLRNGMMVCDAIKRCPQLICLPYAFDEYRKVSKAIYNIVSRYTLEIRAVSCDEMYVDCTKLLNEMHIGDAVAFAEHLRAEIKQETGCPASVGIGKSTLLARLATRHAKPDGVRYVPAEESDLFVANEKVKNLPGMGHQTYAKLVSNFGSVEICSDLQRVPRSDLELLLGKKAGEQLYKLCRGENDEKEFIASSIRKSVSCDINYGIRFTKKSEVAHFLNVIGAELEKKLMSAKMTTKSITLKLMVRSPDAPIETAKYLGHGECDVQNKSSSLEHPTTSAQVISAVALRLFNNISPVVSDVRGIGVQCGRLALASEVGYSATSEAINRMFQMNKNKKEEKKPPQLVHKEETTQERELPPAFSIGQPSFFGEQNMVKTKEDILKYLKNEPNEDAVGVITDFLFYLLRDGCLSTLVSTCLFIHRELFATDAGTTPEPGWLFAMNVIFDSLDERCQKLYGGPAIRPAIFKCKES
ncbi:unnamed protein product [Cylicocyclus nassatus]|uniref:DNA repair protein REV1 n=1 Tax=Cylicocyclus nassatus TaxID=53992 RepID=A0AA36GII8_CYLNA|nr:unnamed protein product [Cylicocyclus nassatus]